MEQPLITIVVPVYRVEEYLPRCVNSLLRQTYPHLEIILVDDGSQDRCGKICDEYASQNKQVRVLHQKNKGLSAARNAGTLIAKGQYITFVDSDDWVDDCFIQRLWESLNHYHADLAICNGIIEPAKELLCELKQDDVITSEQALEAICYQKQIETSAWGKLYRIDHAKKCLYPEGRIFEDMATTYRFLAQAERVALCADPMYHYWQRHDSIMNTSFSQSRFDELTSVDEMYFYVKKHYPVLEKAAICRRFSCYCQVLLLLPADKKQFSAQRRQIFQVLKESRRTVLKDKNARGKNRMAALLCYGGEPLLRLAWANRKKGK